MESILERRYFSIDQIATQATNQTAMVGLVERADTDLINPLPKITGYSAVFGVNTEIQTFMGSFKEQIQKGAFKRAIRERHDVRALRNHDPDNLLGRLPAGTLELSEDNTGLYIEVDTPDTVVGRDTVESIRRGDLSGMSFAFIVRKEKWVNGENGEADLRIIQDVDLYDVGPVTYPAYVQTTADVNSRNEIHKRGIEELKAIRANCSLSIDSDPGDCDPSITTKLDVPTTETKDWGKVEAHWEEARDGDVVSKPKFDKANIQLQRQRNQLSLEAVKNRIARFIKSA